jgi:NTP pyrophosphatase (non-canonical NTP hydrolase)
MKFDRLRIANLARDKEWVGGVALSLSFRGNELAGETGEACNMLKKLDRELMGLRGSRATVEQLAEELADVVICADLIAMTVGFDLGEAVRRKFNATSDKYGLSTKIGE